MPAPRFASMPTPFASPGIDKWTALLASLAVPGSGQLLLGSRWCLAWFVLAGAAVALPERAGSELPSATRHALRLVLLAGVSAASACDAQRAAESRDRRRLPWTPAPGVRARTICFPPRGRAVHLRLELHVPRPAAEVWARAADLPRFLCIDPFHMRVLMRRPLPAAGVGLALEHRAFGTQCWRSGRLLRWDEGCGYAFSDLSERDASRGFPHVFFVLVEPLETRCRLTIDVRGKWTSRWIPLPVGLCWLRFVAREHARLLAAAL